MLRVWLFQMSESLTKNNINLIKERSVRFGTTRASSILLKAWEISSQHLPIVCRKETLQISSKSFKTRKVNLGKISFPIEFLKTKRSHRIKQITYQRNQPSIFRQQVFLTTTWQKKPFVSTTMTSSGSTRCPLRCLLVSLQHRVATNGRLAIGFPKSISRGNLKVGVNSD